MFGGRALVVSEPGFNVVIETCGRSLLLANVASCFLLLVQLTPDDDLDILRRNQINTE